MKNLIPNYSSVIAAIRPFHLAGALPTKLNVVVVLLFFLAFSRLIVRFVATARAQKKSEYDDKSNNLFHGLFI